MLNYFKYFLITQKCARFIIYICLIWLRDLIDLFHCHATKK